MWSAKEKSTARQQNFVRAPKIAMRQFPYANIEQTLVTFRSFYHLDRSRHRNRSNRCGKIDVVRKGEINGAPAKLCSGPENRDASISLCKDTVNACKFRWFGLRWMARCLETCQMGLGWAGWAGLASSPDNNIH